MQFNQCIHVVRSTEIPSEDAASGPRYRDFSADAALRALLPAEERVALAWIEAREGETIERNTALDTILLVLRGAAHLAGGRSLATGDVVTVKADGRYRLDITAPEGFEALAITFARPDTNDGHSEGISSLAELIERNQARVHTTSQGAMFRLVDDGTLDDPNRRAVFLRQIKAVSDTFQKIMIARQATCSDDTYESIFLNHYREEFGHNKLLPCEASALPDPVLNATLAWFTHQMLVRDNAEKSVLVHLVLEGAAEAFFTKDTTREVLAAAGAMDYYQAHLDDDQHRQLGAQLLAGLHPLAYRRLHRMLEDGWDMFDAMGNRLAELVKLEGAGAA